MNESQDSESERQLQFLRVLEEENTWIDNDVVEVDQDTWAIHGVIAYDGEVELAQFTTQNEAKSILERLRDDVGEADGPAIATT